MTKGKRTFILAITFLLVFASVTPLAVAISQVGTQQQSLLFALSLQSQTSPQLPSKQYTSVTWTNPTINNQNVSQNLNITLNGNLTITDTGELYLIHCILNVNNGTNSLNYGINVTGGELYINDSSTITAITPYRYYFFVIQSGSTFQMNDSRVEYCGDYVGGHSELWGLWIATNNAWIENNTISKCYCGLILNNSQGSTILNNNLTNNFGNGILLEKSTSNNLTGNNATNNQYGFYLWNLCNNNNLTGNTATKNSQSGFYVYYSSYCNLTGNNATNNQYGFYIWSGYCNLTGNNATNNQYGFYIREYDNNAIKDNTALNCTTGYSWTPDSINNNFTGSEVLNYLRVNVTDVSGSPISGADVRVETDGTVVYATPHFLGSDPPTGLNGLTSWIIVHYGTFTTNYTMTMNTTTVTVWNSTAYFSRNPRTVNMSTTHVETFQTELPSLPLSMLYGLLLYGLQGGISPMVYAAVGIACVGAVVAVVLFYYFRRAKA
nr:NosD domain-containing protein [Candidatus Freyarchaeota archaeon]